MVIEKAGNENGQAQAPEKVKPEFDLQFSLDKMTAFLSVKNASDVKALTFEEVSRCLAEQGIKYGICEDELRSFCRSGKYYAEIICAKGILNEDGTDGRIEYNFNTQNKLQPKEREDGTVDFRDLGLVQNVQKGAVLCRIIPPVPGKDGVDVFNKVIPFKPGRLPMLPTGTNTVVSEDRLSLLAAVDGCVEYKNTQVNVNDVFMVKGDVGSSSGNVNTLGSVIVKGDVLEGFSVKSGKDVTVRGMVEGAVIETQGSISISNGMNGMGHGVLKAQGNISAKYFENATIFCEGDIYADVMMNCRVQTKGSIILKGKKASLIGGSYQAGRMVAAKTIGTQSHANITITIASEQLNAIFAGGKDMGSTEDMQSKLAETRKALEDMQAKITAISEAIAAGQPGSEERGKLLLKAALIKKSQLAAAIGTIEAEIKKAQEQSAKLTDFKVVVPGIAYQGVKIEIGPYSLQVQQDNSNTKFYANRDGIIFAPVLPSDMP